MRFQRLEITAAALNRNARTKEPIMPKLIAGTFAATLFVGLAAFTAPAGAAAQYPWCVEYGGGRDGFAATSCGFVSFDQCMATASGMHAMCVENPAYYGGGVERIKTRHKSKKKDD
jgi:hypothetical protein